MKLKTFAGDFAPWISSVCCETKVPEDSTSLSVPEGLRSSEAWAGESPCSAEAGGEAVGASGGTSGEGKGWKEE